ncbi:MAG TPA: integrin alpha [Solirubrobacteraceae bacterium]|nr:integrin alpha [Solirubrobacteraceae bacterium]
MKPVLASTAVVAAVAVAAAAPGSATGGPAPAPMRALRIDGPAAGAHLGASVAGAGDVNGDGHPDIVLGSPLGLGGGAPCAGAAYVLFGPFGPGTLDLRTDPLHGIAITGARCREFAGTSVAGAGDVNGDGLDDVVIGAPAGSPDDEGLATASGRAYVVFGRREGGTVDLARLGDRGIVVEGRRRTVTDAFGWAVDGAGDVDRDGLDDIVIAAPGDPGFEERSQPGSSYVVYGRRTGGTVRVRRLGRRGTRIGMTGPGGLRSVAGAGDVDGDGRADVVLGDVSGARGRGAATVVLGGPRRRSLRLEDLGRRGFRLTGRDRGADTGYAVAGGEDVDGDGLDDVLVSAPQGNRARTGAAGGGAFVVFGRRSPRSVDLRALGRHGIEIRGTAPDWAGFAVAAARRVNGDRLGDVALLAHGSLVVVHGRRAPGTIALDRLQPADGLRFDGTIEPNQWYTDAGSGGFITAGAVGGDADGDGSADLLAGVRMADHNERPDSGSAYVLFSPPPGRR